MKTKNPPTILFAIASLVMLTAPSLLNGSPITKADNTNALGVNLSWVGGSAPTSTDVATWSGAYSASPSAAAGLTNSLRAVMSGTPLSWQGISVGALSGTALTTNTFYSGTSGFGAETNISAAAQSGNIVTITTKAAHGFGLGETVTLAGVVPSGFNGTFTILGLPSSTTFTYSTASGLSPGTSFGTVAGGIYIGGIGTVAANSSLTVGSAGIDMSAASHSVTLVASDFAFAGNQTWNLAAGRNLLLSSGTGVGAATAKIVTSGSDGIIDISGNGIVDANQGGSTGFADAAGFTGFTGRWRVNSGATLRGFRFGATAWGSYPGADSIILNGGTLAVGGISGAVGNWGWTNGIKLETGKTSSIDEQNVTGSGRSLKLGGSISGDGNLVFKETSPTATFTSMDASYIISGANTMSGIVTIGGPVENGVTGRLTFVRVGGIGGASSATGVGPDGSLGTATIVNNGVVTFSSTASITVNTISGSGSVRVGYATTVGTENQVVNLTGANTYYGNTTINIGTLTLPAGASLPNTTNIFITPLTAASLIAATLDVSGAGGISLNSGQRIVGGPNNAGGNNTAQINGNVTAGTGSAIVPGGTNVANTLVMNGNLTLTGGATLVYDLNNATGDLLTVQDLNPSGVTTILVNPPAGGLFAGTYTLITPSGTLGGTPANFNLAGLASAGRGQTFNVIYDAGSVKLEVIGSPAGLTWRGDGTANVWNTAITTNWINAGSPDAFYSGDLATFDDSGSNSPPVNLTGALQAGSTTVNAANNYTFAGTGRLTGSGPLTNLGPGTLSILTSNDFTGKTAIIGGGLAITNEAALGANPASFVADQLTLDGSVLTLGAAMNLRNPNRGITLGAGGGTVAHGSFAVTISNTIAGAGTLTKNGAGTLTLSGTNTYAGGTVINDGQVVCGSNQALGRGGNTSGTSGFFVKPFTLRNGILELNGRSSYDPNFAGGTAPIGIPVLVFDNTIVFGGTGGSAMLLRDSGGVVTNGWCSATPQMLVYDATGGPGTATIAARFAASGSSGVTSRTFDVGDSAATAIEVDITGALGVISLDSTNQDGRSTTLIKAGPGTLRVSAPNNFPGWQVNEGTLLVNHPQALGTDRTFSRAITVGGIVNRATVAGGVLDLNGYSPVIGGLADGGNGGTVRNNGGSPSTVTVGISYTNTVDSSFAGTIENGSGGVALVKDGPGTQSLGGANTYTGGTTVSNGTLLVGGSLAGTVRVRSGGTLGGTGTIPGVVTVDPGGVIAPGASIGTLTLNSTPVLNGIVRAEVDRNGGSPLSDQLAVSGNPIAYNGTLAITNTGAPLLPGDTFQLFSASGYSGGVALVSQTPGQLVVWNTSNLNSSGTVSVASVAPPQITTAVNGDTLTLTWPLEASGAQLQVQTNSITVGISTNWVGVADSTASNQINVPIVPSNETVFFRLVYPPQP